MAIDGYLEIGTVGRAFILRGTQCHSAYYRGSPCLQEEEKHTGFLLSPNSFFLCLEGVLFLSMRIYV